jgi:hypothetical protein
MLGKMAANSKKTFIYSSTSSEAESGGETTESEREENVNITRQ